MRDRRLRRVWDEAAKMWRHPDGSAAKNKSEVKSDMLPLKASSGNTRYVVHVPLLSSPLLSSPKPLALPRPSSALPSLALRASRPQPSPKQQHLVAAASAPTRSQSVLHQRSPSCTQSTGPLKRLRPNPKPLLTRRCQWILRGVRSHFAGPCVRDIPIGPGSSSSCFRSKCSPVSLFTTARATWLRRIGSKRMMLRCRTTPPTVTSAPSYQPLLCCILFVSTAASPPLVPMSAISQTWLSE
jgi:hypothetical protein